MSDPDAALRLIQRTLQRRLTALVADAQEERAAGDWTKLIGIVSLGAGGFAAVTSGLAAIPITVGVIAYGSAVLGQARKTGRILLIPFNDTGISELITRFADVPVELPDLEDYAFMSAAQKAEYAMILCSGRRISQALSQLGSDEHRQFAYVVAKRRFMELYGAYIRDTPEILMSTDAAAVAEYLLAGEDDFKELRAAAEAKAVREAESETPGDRSTPAWGAEATGAVGPTTRLTPVEVQSAPMASVNAVHCTMNQAHPLHPQHHTAAQDVPPHLAEDVGTTVQNMLVIGKPGSGKDVLISNAWRAAKEADPNRTIYVIDPKGSPLESGYWQGADCVVSRPCLSLMPLEIWEWVISCIREFQLIEGPKLLILGELRFLSNTFARINDSKTKALDTFWYSIESFTSLGDAQQTHIWGISQSSHTADLKVSGGTLGQFRIIAVVNSMDFGFYDTLVATNVVQRYSEPDHLQQIVAARSPVHRVYYDSKYRQWFPFPELPNFSDLDRDSRSILRNKTFEVNAPKLQTSLNGPPLQLADSESAIPSIERKVLAYLQAKGFVPSHQIKSAVAELKKFSADEVRQFLNEMVSGGEIDRKIKGLSVLYGPIVT